MRKVKKFLAMLVVMAMVFGMSATAFADETGTVPSKSDAALVKVSGVEGGDGVTVTAYRIVEPLYSDKGLGFTGYKAVDGVVLDNMYSPTSSEITAIVADKDLLADLELKALEDKDTPVEVEDVTGNKITTYTYSAELGAGYWVVIVNGSNFQKVYNPMLVGVYYKPEGTGQNNTLIDADSDADVKPIVDANANWGLETVDAFAKSELPQITKTITGSTGKDKSDGNDHGNDVAVDDTVSFKIDTQIPAYSESYTEVKVEITDELSKGLSLADPTNLVVKVGGTEEMNIVAPAEDTYSLEGNTPGSTGFKISFASDYALEYSGEKVYVTYDAVLGDGVGYDFDANENVAKLIYTNDPHNKDNTNSIKDKTYTYTFAIDTKLYGQGSEVWNYLTEELFKTGEKEVINASGEKVIEKVPLSGAEFTLTRKDGKAVTSESKDGYIEFKGLDAAEYTLVETKAPEGYSLNDTEIPVKIEAGYNDDGTLDWYKITVNGEKTSTYTATYTGETKERTITNVDVAAGHDVPDELKALLASRDGEDISDTQEIVNTRLVKLPSTGGIGTTIFTIGGCAIMVIAAGLYFAVRRKKEKD